MFNKIVLNPCSRRDFSLQISISKMESSLLEIVYTPLASLETQMRENFTNSAQQYSTLLNQLRGTNPDKKGFDFFLIYKL